MNTFSEKYYNIIKDISSKNYEEISGTVTSVCGLMLEARGLSRFAALGSNCVVVSQSGARVNVEVVAVKGDTLVMMPFSDIAGIGAGDKVIFLKNAMYIRPSARWLGRVINAFGEPIDNRGPLHNGDEMRSLNAAPPKAHERRRVEHRMNMGIRSINTFLTCCKGQRMGIFAGSGVGKSMMLAMLTKFADSDIKIIGLIGERGREVQEFIEDYLGAEGLAKSIVVVSTSDESSLARRQAAYLTMTLAEYFRDKGMDVICMIDSITRFAMAQREIGLASEEPPTTRGYTPSVFTELPKLLERAGPGSGNQGDITGLFSVLVEGDDMNEPVADAVRGTLDGHIVLRRSIASKGIFPAVDILSSVSRTMHKCNSTEEIASINYAKRIMSTYKDMEDMIRIGAYKRGSDPHVDEAIQKHVQIEKFISQLPNECDDIAASHEKLKNIVE